MRHLFPWVAAILLAGCANEAPPPKMQVTIDEPQVAVGQSWQEMENRSLYAPTVQALNQARVIEEFEAITNPSGRQSLGLSFQSRQDFELAIQGARFEELDGLAQKIQKPSDAGRWHVYGAWINAVARSFDSKASFYPPSRQDAVSTMITASEEGVGLELSTLPSGGVSIVSVNPDGPAMKAGIHPGDVLIGIKEQEGWIDMTQSNAYDAQSLLRGPTGSKVSLKIKRAEGAVKVFVIRREKWFLDDMRVKARNLDGQEIVSVPSFYVYTDPHSRWDVSTQKDLANALSDIPQPKRFILDLRGNPGGVLEQAREVGQLIGLHGVAWTIQTRELPVPTTIEDRKTALPLAVWIDGNTGSSAEILAGSLQKLGVKVIGAPSFGKTTMQLMVPLDQPSLKRAGQSKTGNLLLTTARVSWDDKNSSRVEPDCPIASLDQDADQQYLAATRDCIANQEIE